MSNHPSLMVTRLGSYSCHNLSAYIPRPCSPRGAFRKAFREAERAGEEEAEMSKVATKPSPAVGKGESPDRLVWRPRRGSQPLPREALGHRPLPLRGAARQGLDVTGRAGRNARARGLNSLPKFAEVTVLETQNATMERCKARRAERPVRPRRKAETKVRLAALRPPRSSGQGVNRRPASRGQIGGQNFAGKPAQETAVRVPHALQRPRHGHRLWSCHRHPYPRPACWRATGRANG